MRRQRARRLLLLLLTMMLGASRSARSQTQSWDRCMVGVSYGAPFKMAVSYARGRVLEAEDVGADVCNYASAKLGVGGARFALGTSRTSNALGGAAGLSVGVLRTFGTPLHAARWSNYAGAAVHVLPALGLGGEIGYFMRVGGHGATPRRMVTWSMGFGF